MKNINTIENLHLFIGFGLIICGIMSYPLDSLGSMLSWAIFGAMYISMSDIGEEEMSTMKKSMLRHKVRFFGAYLGVILTVWLFIYLLLNLI